MTALVAPGRNLTWELANTLGGKIVRGDYAPGAVIPTEGALSAEFGVGRSVVREAIKMLTAKGLIDVRPKRGTMVRHGSAWNLLDGDVLGWALGGAPERDFFIELVEMRSLIEPEAAAMAARRQDPVHLAQLRLAYEGLARAAASHADTVPRDFDFHRALIVASGNRFMQPLLKMHEAALTISFRLTNSVFGPDFNLPAHEEILLAIEAADAERAREATRKLLIASREVFERALVGPAPRK
jgi:DNA-binding FadR family transcriptional regulator